MSINSQIFLGLKLTKKKYYLITSSDESTWKFDRPVIFLGEWCRLETRKHIWKKMDAIVAKPYGFELQKREKYIYSFSIPQHE